MSRNVSPLLNSSVRRPTTSSLIVVVVTLVVATLARAALAPLFGARAPFATYLIGALVIAWYGGLVPSLLALIAGSLLAVYFFVPPYGMLMLRDLADLVNWITYLVVGITAALLSESLHAARIKASASADLAEGNLRRLEEEMRARERAQADIQAQRNWRDVMAETVPNILFTSLPEGGLDYLNRRFYDYTGLLPDMGLGTGWRQVIHPDDVSTHQAVWDAARATGTPYENEMRLRSAEGDYRWFVVRSRPLRGNDGTVTKWLGAATDVHDLRESEWFNKQITQTLPDIVYIYDIVEQRSVYTNRAMHQLLGYTPEQVQAMGQNVLPSLIHPDDVQHAEDATSRLIQAQDGEIVESEYRVKDANGNWRWLYGRNSVFRRNLDGTVREIFGVAQDISDRKWVEQEYQYVLDAQQSMVRQLQEANALLDTLFASANVGLAFFDREIRFRRINRTLAEEINGLPVDAHFGHTPRELLPDLAVEATETMFRRVIETRAPIEFETSGYTPGTHGKLHYWLASYYPVYVNDDLIGVGIVIVDITNRKHAEQRTRLLQEVTAALSSAATPQGVARAFLTETLAAIGASGGAVALVSDDGETLAMVEPVAYPDPVRQKFARVPVAASVPIADAVKRNAVIWLEDRGALLERYPTLADAEEMLRDTQGFVCLPLSVSNHVIGGLGFSFAEPHPMREDERAFLLALAQQCAQALERALLYQKEATAREQAENANAIKLKFLAMISHELRTPLTSIKGFTSTLLADDVVWEQETQREFLDIMNEETDKLTDLVEQLLDVSRIHAGILGIEPSEQALDAIMDTADQQLETLAAAHVLDINIPSVLPAVMADNQRVAQVIVNLVGNAAKYAPPGSRITLSAARDDSFVRIDVTDEGEGIPPDEREAVFEAFRQVERKTRQRGAGLGLAICKGLIEAHGGRIWIQDRPAPGTTVSFTLPVAP